MRSRARVCVCVCLPVEDVEGVGSVELSQSTDLERVEVVWRHELPKPLPNRGFQGGQCRRQLGLCLSEVYGAMIWLTG